jgi:hypothetical protein
MNKTPSEISAKSRTGKVVERMRAAMASMQEQIDAAGGVYPGRLSLNEVCRRAGVHPITMQGSAHVKTTKPIVLAWIAARRRSTATRRRDVRSVGARVTRGVEDELRELAAHFRLRENEIPRLNAEIVELKETIERLEAENSDLRAAVSNRVVTPIGKRK